MCVAGTSWYNVSAGLSKRFGACFRQWCLSAFLCLSIVQSVCAIVSQTPSSIKNHIRTLAFCCLSDDAHHLNTLVRTPTSIDSTFLSFILSCLKAHAI